MCDIPPPPPYDVNIYTHKVKGKREGNSRLWWYGLFAGGLKEKEDPSCTSERGFGGVCPSFSRLADDGNRMRMKKGPTNEINSSSASSVAGWISSEFDTSSPVLLRLRCYCCAKDFFVIGFLVSPCAHISASVCVCLILGNFFVSSSHFDLG